jgi:hypothetical protein
LARPEIGRIARVTEEKSPVGSESAAIKLLPSTIRQRTCCYFSDALDGRHRRRQIPEADKPAARRIFDMKRVSSLVRSTSSRIGRRLAVIIEAAAAGLASAGV